MTSQAETEPDPNDPALAVHCPRCAAVPGALCRTAERVPRRPHRRRRAAYARTSALPSQ
ncbi:zinc finger domain-containing protein [Cellulomonas aerilata]|uniref:zinc finger domain-containing protein n=1 Tax=Cellulomonas aerilata TaxID=515326 RepID=UPI003CD06E16